MTEANYENWRKSLQNFEWLQGAVPGATDLDCFIHAGTRSGDRFLLFEFKQVGEKLGLGQRLGLEAMRRQVGWTVVTCWGPDAEGMYVLGMDWGGKVDKEGLLTLVRNWWTAAKGTAE